MNFPHAAKPLVPCPPLLGPDGHPGYLRVCIGRRHVHDILLILLPTRYPTPVLGAQPPVRCRGRRHSIRYGRLRGGVFSLLGLFAMLPIFHSAGQMGWSRACVEIGAGWYLAEALTLLTGVGLFVSRIPERLSPGSFDIWGHSHQLFHVCAVLGGVFHAMALVTGYLYRQTHPVCFAPS